MNSTDDVMSPEIKRKLEKGRHNNVLFRLKGVIEQLLPYTCFQATSRTIPRIFRLDC